MLEKSQARTMTSQVSEINEQLLSLWEGMKPREASELKFIVMSDEGFFAGQFTCDLDDHGDRYFVVQQAPRTKKWSLASNLVSYLEDDSSPLPKTAIKLREEYKEVIAGEVYRLEPSHTIGMPVASESAGVTKDSDKNDSGPSANSELFRQPTPLMEADRYNPEDVSDVVDFPPGRYFIGDPCYAIPDEHWEEFIDGIEGEAIDLEGVGRSVFYSHQYESDDEGLSYPTDSGLIGVTCVDHLKIGEWERLKKLGRLVEFTDGEQVARDEEGEEIYGEWESAFRTYHDNNGNIFLGWNWFYANGSPGKPAESGKTDVAGTGSILQFTINNDSKVDTEKSLIYMWEIKEVSDGSVIGRYVGKSSKGASRPLTHYARNVANLLAGKPYRKDNPNGFRRVHHALANAARQSSLVELHFLTNVSDHEDINEIERRYIRQHDSAGEKDWQLNDKKAEQ
jgi:hypothetical protein